MKYQYSEHWIRKWRHRSNITLEMIDYAISNSTIIKDRIWTDAFNAICRVPDSGRLLKVAYRKKEKAVKIITAYWLD